MGLDMNLYRCNKIKYPITINNRTQLSDLIFKVYDIEIAYWRYGTPIHEFFENKIGRTIQNCEYVKIEKDWLVELYNICLDILDKCTLDKEKDLVSDVEYCKKVLPTSNKFNENFCRYDEWYYNTVFETKFKISKILDEVKFDKEEVFYEADW